MRENTGSESEVLGLDERKQTGSKQILHYICGLLLDPNTQDIQTQLKGLFFLQHQTLQLFLDIQVERLDRLNGDQIPPSQKLSYQN